MRDDALLNAALEAFQAGHFADALIDAEYLCRRFPHMLEPAVLRAHVLQACKPELAARAWYQAWQCQPGNAGLQDMLLRTWIAAGEHHRVCSLAPVFLPGRCRDGSQGELLNLFLQAGGSRIGACWRDGAWIEGRVYALNTGAGTHIRLLLDDGERVFAYDVPANGALFRIEPPHAAPVWSLTMGAQGDAPAQLMQGSPLAFAGPAPAAAPLPEPQGGRPVDIIVPVYRDEALVRRCLDGVLASLAHNRVQAIVTVVDDASPELGLSAWLNALARAGRIVLLRNRVNLGFIEAVNRALHAHPGHDPLLLNADTMVYGDWIDRMRATLYSAADIASATAWSNNGEVSSFPEIAFAAPMPTAAQAAQLDRTAAALHARGQLHDAELPACCGFGMLMRRTAVDQVGMLDGVALQRGYGEEVDWCQRASAAGYRHMLSAGVFIAHAGGASFGAEKVLRVKQNGAVVFARYPDYSDRYEGFLRTDPLEPMRRRLSAALDGDALDWLRGAEMAYGQLEQARPYTSTALPAASKRIAVWRNKVTAPGAAHILALARAVATARLPLRLLVVGEASEALRRTGVVDVVPFKYSALMGGLPNADLLGLAGCEAVLAEDAAGLPDGLALTAVTPGFDAADWLAQRYGIGKQRSLTGAES